MVIGENSIQLVNGSGVFSNLTLVAKPDQKGVPFTVSSSSINLNEIAQFHPIS